MKSDHWAMRIEVQFSWKPTESLENIQLAKEAYPADKLPKLLEREKMCRNMKRLATEYSPDKFFKLSYQANSQIPWIIDSLKCRHTKYGFGIFTTRDLKPGDIISIEKSSLSIMEKSVQYNRCCNCLKSAMMNLLPCLKSASLMFCSAQCRESIYKKFKDLDDVLCEYDEIDGTLFNYNKAQQDMIEAFGGDKKLIDFLQNDDLKKTIFDYDWSKMTDLQQKETLFKCLISLNDDFSIAATDCAQNAQGNQLVIDAVERLHRISSKFGVLLQAQGPFKNVQEGLAVFNFATMFKHSCQANIKFVTKQHEQVLYVARSIKAGEELTIDAM